MTNPSQPDSPAAKPKATPLDSSLHQTDADEDDDNVRQLQQCSSFYLSLQDCLVKTNRHWKSCQNEVRALKLCNERRKKNREI